jgi:hypothetical protein
MLTVSRVRTGAPPGKPRAEDVPGPSVSVVIVIDPDLFDFDDSRGYSLETFVVTGDVDQTAVMDALARASARFLGVGQDGAEGLDPVEAAAADVFLPSYVSDPRVTERGIEVYVDGGGAIDPPMAATLRRVLREELAASVANAGVMAVR